MEELNLRYFALEGKIMKVEGRIDTLEEVGKVEGSNRTELLKTVLQNQEKAEKRLRSLEIRMAVALGIVLMAKFIIEMIHK